jgi:hypothetical protein
MIATGQTSAVLQAARHGMDDPMPHQRVHHRRIADRSSRSIAVFFPVYPGTFITFATKLRELRRQS